MKETKKQKEKIAKVMHEFKKGELHIGKSDKIVKNPKQAVAIALSQAHTSKKMVHGGEVDKTITVEIYGGKKINYTDSEIQEMIDEIDMYMSSDNLPKWIIQSRKNGNINFPKDKKGVLEFLNKIKDSKNDVYINVDSTIPPFKHYIKMANGGGVEKDFKFNYMMLDRLQSDNDYYLKHPDEQNLWAGSVDKQISEMKKLWNELPKDKKPEWLSMEDILEYEKKMKKNYANGGLVEKQKTKKNDKYFIREEYDSNGNKYNAVNLSYETGLKDIEYYKKDKSYVYENGVFYKKSTGNLSMIFRESKLYSEGGDIGECYYTIGGL